MNETRPRVLDWTAILQGLAQLQVDCPFVLESNVLVGGAACMFYRDQLEQIHDRDFEVREFSPAEEKVWLSRDADFATTDPARIPERTGDVPLGRLQAGFVIGADEFRENARTVTLNWHGSSVTFLIADPLDLWREKEAAIVRLRRSQDPLHLEVLSITLQWELFYYAEKVATGFLSFDAWKSRLNEIQRRWNSVLDNAPLKARLKSLGVSEITMVVDQSEPRV